ncbi:GTP pyrophosphokinase [uncultured Desulfobacterium sp.]|uniref:GTP pyrophosphokinase n=1 Tax=uncultured Desulfobacterium sp. TaxID=201089 RepID=A0A445MYD0_9BACT|nr:GTP pyrophosphokinase [uncultured Desulfobacterium sp.]
MIRLNNITREILSYHPKANIRLVEKAYVYSAKVHHGQIRLSGEPYLSHPLEAAYILSQLKMDEVCIAAGLLHDVLEDTSAELEEIRELFGAETANIVDGVTKISKMQFSSSKQRQAENVRKMILAMSSDIRVIIVKIADRLHNMRTLGFQAPEKQRRIAKETLEIYAPLAGRMGIQWIKSNLEDLCLFYLEPEIYEKIKTEAVHRRDEGEKFIIEFTKILSEKLTSVGIQANIKGRPKHFYSIYKKMLNQNLNVNQVHDILAFRVIVNSVSDCYAALGHIHSMWKPVPGRVKDYISVPKANKYQSLHTTVVTPWGQRMEVQIRTHEMDRVAEAGIAAHWKYKDGAVSKADESQFEWLNQLLEWQKSLKDPVEFLETVRMDLFPNEVYVFTPRGEVKEFPAGSTPVDFAYAIHSEVGQKCMGALVNGKMVTLKYQLRTGDIVEILTSPKQHPRKNWLEFVKTPRAKTRIRQWINSQVREESINLGRDILEKDLQKVHLTVPNLIRSEQLAAVSRELSFHSVEDMVAQIGLGKISAKQVIGRLKPRLGVEEEKPAGLVSKVVGRMKRRKADGGIRVKGVDDMLVRFANCCHPIPGEDVIGFITRGRGITIHHKACQHIPNTDKERLVEVSWEATSDDIFIARIRVTSIDRKGVLADVTTIITQNDANIVESDVKTTSDQKGIANFTVEVGNYKQLQEIIRAIKRVKDVLIVERL